MLTESACMATKKLSIGQLSRPQAQALQLDELHRQTLLQIARSKGATQFEALQAKIVLMAADGVSNKRIALALATTKETVRLWRDRFERRGLEGLKRIKPGPRPKEVRSEWHKTVEVIRASRLAPPPKMDRVWTLTERATTRPGEAEADLQALLPSGHPPCFASRQTWLDYMTHAAASAKTPAASPVIWLKTGERRLNSGFDFCEDCEAGHRARMLGAGRCEPRWLSRCGA